MPFQQSAVDIPSIEMRIAGGADYINSDHPLLPPQTNLWLRDTAPIEGDLANQALLCASTGTMLIGTAMLPHRGIGQDQAHRTISTGVVGHTIAFHEPFDLNDWLLLAQESVYAGRGRVHGRARVFDGRGQLVASYVQDAIIRHFSDGQDHTSEARTVM
jgi:acyl-CoA thioesterase II